MDSRIMTSHATCRGGVAENENYSIFEAMWLVAAALTNQSKHVSYKQFTVWISVWHGANFVFRMYQHI